MRPILVVTLGALLMAGCSSSNTMPHTALPVQNGAGSTASGASPSGPMSAVRGPDAAKLGGGAAGGRHTLGLSASPWPLTAVPWPLTAVPWPLTAVPWQGSAPPATAPACNDNGHGAHCKADVNENAPVQSNPNTPASSIAGVQPGLLQWLYNLPSKGGAGQTVALVVAYDDPAAEADLAVYRQSFGLPPCTSANGCFSKIAGNGSGTLPSPDYGWATEASLDLDAVSATCPQCKLMLVEAASGQIPDLAQSVDTAVASGANEVSNSYGVAEASDNVAYDSHYNHPGVAITAAAGDIGYGVQFPASSEYVTAVGGTSIQQIGNNSVQEVAWPLSGSGCSQYIAKPSYQTDNLCKMRTVNDVAVVADPADGLAVYDSSLNGPGSGGWAVIGGTSMGAPIVAAMYALAATGAAGNAASLYNTYRGHNQPLLDVTAGSDGTCAVAGLCTSAPGYDGPTGVGVPWGVGAFAPGQTHGPGGPGGPNN
ncbi:MAG: peptidase S8 [Candidatus Eremiobacteraeota bacterium]|nr:peptidase S8 [Candidatus Eremiobacteraeota bacterium]MBC5801498.1 peptidase S8 [Candidatus Eremiobacteraeota bacterium]MBC5822209.1 peptidase S8 [Candidatus Eremiobacteraeota bacterium]